MEIKQGHVYSWKVVFIAKTHLIAKTIDEEFTGLLHISEISDYYVSSISSFFTLGEIYDFYVLKFDGNEKIELSWKKITPRFQKLPFKYQLNETPSGFKSLKNFIEKEVEND